MRNRGHFMSKYLETLLLSRNCQEAVFVTFDKRLIRRNLKRMHNENKQTSTLEPFHRRQREGLLRSQPNDLFLPVKHHRPHNAM